MLQKSARIIRPFRKASADDYAAFAALWNSTAFATHGFFPISEDIFKASIVKQVRFREDRLLLALDEDKPIGFVHFDIIDEPYYPLAGVIEAIGVVPEYRNCGVGSKLIELALKGIEAYKTDFVEGYGAWPFTPFYSTFIDGSERSGVFLANSPLLALFKKYGFGEARKSYVMQLKIEGTVNALPLPFGYKVEEYPRQKNSTWLDYVFREWKLINHVVTDHKGEILTRAIYGRMDGYSNYSGRECYALFGVNTPDSNRRKGLAYANLSNTIQRISELGGEEVELHVYADNMPAVGLYSKLGFKIVDTTVSMRRPT
ncbi:MAG: GNAT family N-acetyltransferase [Planctomycetes bacterium]|nr:GNAT family N-acetyltransferase [Planctomycetota bacterium]